MIKRVRNQNWKITNFVKQIFVVENRVQKKRKFVRKVIRCYETLHELMTSFTNLSKLVTVGGSVVQSLGVADVYVCI